MDEQETGEGRTGERALGGGIADAVRAVREMMGDVTTEPEAVQMVDQLRAAGYLYYYAGSYYLREVPDAAWERYVTMIIGSARVTFAGVA